MSRARIVKSEHGGYEILSGKDLENYENGCLSRMKFLLGVLVIGGVFSVLCGKKESQPIHQQTSGIEQVVNNQHQQESNLDQAVKSPEYQSYRSKTPLVYLCSEWKDINNNGFIDYPREVVNEKNQFAFDKDEKIVFCNSFVLGYDIPQSYLNKKMVIEVNDSQNNTKAVKEYRIGSRVNEDQIAIRMRNLLLGDYTAIWKVDDRIIGRRYFQVMKTLK